MHPRKGLREFSDLPMNGIMALPHVRNVHSSIVLNELKNTTMLELETV